MTEQNGAASSEKKQMITKQRDVLESTEKAPTDERKSQCTIIRRCFIGAFLHKMQHSSEIRLVLSVIKEDTQRPQSPALKIKLVK